MDLPPGPSSGNPGLPRTPSLEAIEQLLLEPTTIVNGVYSYYNPQMFCEQFATMREYLGLSLYCDVNVVSCDAVQIQAHKLVLSASSKYFEGLLSQPGTRGINTLHISVCGEVFRVLLLFFYTARIDIRRDNVKEILHGANVFLVNSVVDACSYFLQQTLEPSNCMEISTIAEEESLESLLNFSNDFICNNFTIVTCTPHFLSWDKKHITKFLKFDKLKVPNEDFLFDRVDAWLSHDNPTREVYATELFELLKLKLLSNSALYDILTKYSEIIKYSMPLLATFYQRLFEKPVYMVSLLKKYDGPSRIYETSYFLVLGNDNKSAAGTIDVYDGQSWSQLSDLTASTSGIYNFSAVICPDSKFVHRLLIIGGERDGVVYNGSYMYNPRSEIIEEMACKQSPRSCAGVALARYCNNGTYIYYIGGTLRNGELSSTVEIFENEREFWIKQNPINFARASFGIAVLNDVIYIAGGIVKDRNDLNDVETNSVEFLVVSSKKPQQWQIGSPMITRRQRFCLVAAGQYLYAFGGVNFQSEFLPSVEQYDPASRIWTNYTNLPLPARGLSGCSYGDNIVICGGETLYQLSSRNVWMFIPSVKLFVWMSPMARGRADATIIHVPYFFRNKQ